MIVFSTTGFGAAPKPTRQNETRRYGAEGFATTTREINDRVARLGPAIQEAYAETVEEFAKRLEDAARRNLGRSSWLLSREISHRTKFYADENSAGEKYGVVVGFVGVRGSLDLVRRWRQGVRSREINALTGETRDKRLAASAYSEPIVYYRFHESGYYRRMAFGKMFDGWIAVRDVDGTFRAEKRFRDVKIRKKSRINSTSGNYVATKALRFFKRAEPTASDFVDAIFAINQTVANEIFDKGFKR